MHDLNTAQDNTSGELGGDGVITTTTLMDHVSVVCGVFVSMIRVMFTLLLYCLTAETVPHVCDEPQVPRSGQYTYQHHHQCHHYRYHTTSSYPGTGYGAAKYPGRIGSVADLDTAAAGAGGVCSV